MKFYLEQRPSRATGGGWVASRPSEHELGDSRESPYLARSSREILPGWRVGRRDYEDVTLTETRRLRPTSPYP